MNRICGGIQTALAGLACAALALIGGGGRIAPAAEPAAPRPPAYQPAGAPVDPKVPAQWNRYLDHAQASEFLQKLAAAHPTRCRLVSLGKSYGGREMWVLTITNQAQGIEQEKAGYWIDGGIHANEIQSVEVVLYTAWYLLEMYARNELVTRLVDERVFYLLPMLSPDSRDAHFYRPNTTHSPRSGQRPLDDDKDGLIDEDGPDDLDGDGHLVQMRIRDPNGRWKPHPKYPQLLVRAAEDERGEFTLLGAEGLDNDGDGEVNEDGDGYYDPNRDFPWNWQPDHIQRGAWKYPFSVPENRMMSEFVSARPNIAAAQSYHNTGGMILYGPGSKSDKYPDDDVRIYKLLTKRGESLLPGYKGMNVGQELYEVWGGEFDWFHRMLGAWAVTNELFTDFNYFRRSGGDSDEDQHLFNKYLLLEDGLVPWHAHEHPQFGRIELGGYKKNWRRQPPSFLIEEECHRNMAFTFYHADQMPRAEIESVSVRPREGGLREVTAVIANRKLLPTRSADDVKNQVTPADRVTLSGPEAKVALAFSADELLFREPQVHDRRPEEVRLDRVGSQGVVYVRWLVQGPGPYTVEYRSVKGGVSRRMVETP